MISNMVIKTLVTYACDPTVLTIVFRCHNHNPQCHQCEKNWHYDNYRFSILQFLTTQRWFNVTISKSFVLIFSVTPRPSIIQIQPSRCSWISAERPSLFHTAINKPFGVVVAMTVWWLWIPPLTWNITWGRVCGVIVVSTKSNACCNKECVIIWYV